MRFKKIWCLILSCILFFVGTNMTKASDVKSYDFSAFTESDAICYIDEQGIVMPDGLEDIEGYENIILGIIQAAYEREDYRPCYNYTEMYTFASEIAESVRRNTNRGSNIEKTDTRASSYTLQYSTQYGLWKDSYLNYNCYGYAIGKQSKINPGVYSGNEFTLNTTISQLASYVKQDLVNLGYIVNVSTSRPTSLSTGQNMICVRRGVDDYHFMKYSGIAWYHKPGNTSLLKFNNSSVELLSWNNECLFPDVDDKDNDNNRTELIAYEPNIWYDSTIYYITYWTSTGSDVGTASISLK